MEIDAVCQTGGVSVVEGGWIDSARGCLRFLTRVLRLTDYSEGASSLFFLFRDEQVPCSDRKFPFGDGMKIEVGS